MATVICGIDPGLNGSFAFLDLDSSTLRIVDMPTFEKNDKRHTDPLGVSAVLLNNPPQLICIEQVHSSRQMGVASSFSFGRSFGILLGCSHACGARVLEVVPSVWKPKMGCTADKKQTVQRASTLLPDCKTAWKLVKHTDRAEAALLAIYGTIKFGFKVPQNIQLIE